MNLASRHFGSHIGWPVTRAVLPSCITFCLPDRLGNGTRFTSENFAQFPALEELGIIDWDRQVIEAIVPENQPAAVWLLASTWRMTKLSKWNLDGRRALADGVHWTSMPGGRVFATIPEGSSTGRHKVMEFVGYDNEQLPEFIFVRPQELEVMDNQPLVAWSEKPEHWRVPCQLLQHQIERLVAFYDNWIYIGTRPDLAQAVSAIVQGLAEKWRVPLIEGPPEWRWLA